MPNITIQDINVGSAAKRDDEYKDDLLTLAGADVLLPGTILARDSVSNKLVLFVKGGATNGNGIPKAILTYGVTTTGAGDVKIRALVKGTVSLARIVIDADGTNVNIDNAVIDQLRDYGIYAEAYKQFGGYDTHD